MKKDLEALLRRVEDAGCTVVQLRKHYRVSTPNGPVFVSHTPSDHRGLLNLRAQLRRKGVDL